MKQKIRFIYGCRVVSEEEKDFSKIRRAFVFLREKDSNSFKYVLKYLKSIVVLSISKQFNEAILEKKTWLVSSSVISDKSYPYQYLASVFIHESCHIQQFLEKRFFVGRASEAEAYNLQKKFLKKVGYMNAVNWLEEQFKNKWWNDKKRYYLHKEIEQKLKKIDS